MAKKKIVRALRRAAFFDVAGTLTLLPMFVPFSRVLLRKKLFSEAAQREVEKAYADYAAGRITEQEYVPLFKKIQARGFKGKRRADVERAAAAYFKAGRFRLRLFAKPLVALLKKRGYRVVLVSGSLTEEIAPIAAWLGADAVFAQELEVDASGRYTGRYVFVAAAPEAKARIARAYARKAGVDLRRSLAFGDMFLDEGMMRVVGHAVALNAVPGFKKKAKSQKWFVVTQRENVVKKVGGLLNSLN